jgi:hypothetical protein
MKTNKLTFVTLLSALFITAGAFTPGYAVDQSRPPIKVEKSGGDCTQAQCQKVFADAGQTCTNAKDTKSDGFCQCECYDVGGSRKIKK